MFPEEAGQTPPNVEQHHSSGSIVLTPETGRVYISPIGFWARAEDFLDASVLLHREAGRFSFVAAHLACTAIELALKAFLLTKDYSREAVRKLGHDLHACLVESFVRGLEDFVALTPTERQLLLRVNGDYVDRNFVYFDINSALVRPKDAELEHLPTIAGKILKAVKQVCLDATGG